jgi:hypothetical protein
MLLRARIECLGDHDGTDDHAEQGAGEQGGAGTGAEQPESAAAFAKLGRGKDLHIIDVRHQLPANGAAVGIGIEANDDVGRLSGRHPRVGPRPLDVHEHERRRGE